MSTVDNNTENADNAVDDIEDGIDLPDDFFDEFEDSKFLDEIVDIVVPEQTRLVRTTDDDTSNVCPTETGNDQRERQRNDDEQTEPLLDRCLDKINNLEKSIKRRKQRLQNDMLVRAHNDRKRRSHSPPISRSDRNVRSRDRRSPPRRSPSGPPRNGRRGRSRSRERNNRSRERRTSRRDRSRSGSPIKHPSRGMSFLEELERKFAEKGQDFPEKDLLIQLRAQNNGSSIVHHNPIGYPQEVPMYSTSPYMQMPIYNQPYHQPYWNGNGNYMQMPSNVQQMPFLPTNQPMDTATNTNVMNNATKDNVKKPPCNKDEVVARCRTASKILRGEENKVPKLRFLFTRTALPVDASEEATLPLQSRKNVEFVQTSENQKPFAPLQFLPQRTRELVKILGYNCSGILDRLRLKNFADKVITEIEDFDAEKRRTKERTYKTIETQTELYKCPTCGNRESKKFTNKSVQTETPTKKVSIRTQTNERDYREPLIRQLTRMTAGQLVAVSDFVSLICDLPRPTTQTEIVNVREKLMDIYNLSERGPEAVEAERSRDHDQWSRRGINSNSMSNSPIEDLRATIRGTSDHNMGRIPPPPPLLGNYHMDVGLIDPEQELLLQQMRFEENVRMLQLEEQRNREMEWERQQHIQRQLQLQREQEEESAMLEMRNDRRNGFGRGKSWHGGRGNGRY